MSVLTSHTGPTLRTQTSEEQQSLQNMLVTLPHKSPDRLRMRKTSLASHKNEDPRKNQAKARRGAHLKTIHRASTQTSFVNQAITMVRNNNKLNQNNTSSSNNNTPLTSNPSVSGTQSIPSSFKWPHSGLAKTQLNTPKIGLSPQNKQEHPLKPGLFFQGNRMSEPVAFGHDSELQEGSLMQLNNSKDRGQAAMTDRLLFQKIKEDDEGPHTDMLSGLVSNRMS